MENETPRTSPQSANAIPLNQMRLTPRGVPNVPIARVFPEIRGGQCEFCGTVDPRQPGHLQYKLCPHYRGREMRCTFCPEHKDQEEVVRLSRLIVRENPYRPGEIVTHCGNFECVRKFEQMFKT